jgi:hypothetical protein
MEEALAFAAQPDGSINGLRYCGNGITGKRRQRSELLLSKDM